MKDSINRGYILQLECKQISHWLVTIQDTGNSSCLPIILQDTSRSWMSQLD